MTVINFTQGLTINNSSESVFELDINNGIDQTTVVIIHDGSGEPLFSGSNFYKKEGDYQVGQINFIYLTYLIEINGVVINIQNYVFNQYTSPPMPSNDYGLVDLTNKGHFSALTGHSQWNPVCLTSNNKTVFSLQGAKQNNRKPILLTYDHSTELLDIFEFPHPVDNGYHAMGTIGFLDDGNMLFFISEQHNLRTGIYKTQTPFDFNSFVRISEITQFEPAYFSPLKIGSRWVAIYRGTDKRNIYLTYSDDNCVTWSEPQHLITSPPPGYWKRDLYPRLVYGTDKLRFVINTLGSRYEEGYWFEVEPDMKTITNIDNTYSVDTDVSVIVTGDGSNQPTPFQIFEKSPIQEDQLIGCAWMDELGNKYIIRRNVIMRFVLGSWEEIPISLSGFTDVMVWGQSGVLVDGNGVQSLMICGRDNSDSTVKPLVVKTTNNFDTHPVELLENTKLVQCITPFNYIDNKKLAYGFRSPGTYEGSNFQDPDIGYSNFFIKNSI